MHTGPASCQPRYVGGRCLSTAGWGLRRNAGPGVRDFLEDKLLPAVLDVSAPERGKLQTPTEVGFAGARSAATRRHNLPLCKRKMKPAFFVFFLHQMEAMWHVTLDGLLTPS